MKSEVFLKEHLHDYFANDLYLAPKIPEKKLVNAASRIAQIDANYVLAVVDETLFGSAKEGLLFTGDSLYIKNSITNFDSVQIKYDQVKTATYHEEHWQDKNDKEQINRTLTIDLSDQEKPLVFEADNRLMEPIAHILKDISEQVDETESSEQLLQLSDLDSDVVLAYLELIINFLKRDGILDRDEYANLAGLLGTTDISDSIKDDLRNYRLDSSEVRHNDDLLSVLKNNVPLGSQITIFQSLINNLLEMMTDEDKEHWQDIAEFTVIQKQLAVTDEQVDFFLKKQQQDQMIVRERLNDKHASTLQKQLLSLGTGVGASLAALGVTGIAVGAFGELGLGMLAFASMSTGGLALAAVGIGAAGIAGYNGIQKLSKGDAAEKSDIRQSLLQKTIARQDSALTLLLGDINNITDRITELVDSKEFEQQKNEVTVGQVASLRHLIGQLRAAKDASSTVQVLQGDGERELAMSHLPTKLNVDKIEDLLKRSQYATKFGELLDACYHFRDEGDNELDKSVGVQHLKMANQILKQLGYFKVTTTANAKEIGKKGLAFLSDKLN